MRDAAPKIEERGAAIFGISTDGVAKLVEFAKATGISYPLLSDEDQKISKRYGVLREGRGYARRVTFVVDPSGVVRHVFDKVDVRTHGAEVLAVLTRLGAASGGDSGHTGVLDEDGFKALHELKAGKAPKLHGQRIELGKGHAYLALPKGKGPHPGVVVIHEWWGLNVHVKHWADRLAADGYAAVAVDLYGGNVATTRDEALRFMRSADEATGAAVIAKALDFLAKDPRILAPKRATIGWCFGGGWSLKAAMAHADLDAAVIYYGRLKTDPAVLLPIKAKLLGVFGNKDRGIPPATVDAFEKGLAEAKVEAKILRFDANHAFANPSSARYDEKSAGAAWAEVRSFLRKTLAPAK